MQQPDSDIFATLVAVMENGLDMVQKGELLAAPVCMI